MTQPSTAAKSVRRKPEYVAGNRVVGVTSDGVKLLRGPGRPRQFTLKEIREAVATVRAGPTSDEGGSGRVQISNKRRPDGPGKRKTLSASNRALVKIDKTLK